MGGGWRLAEEVLVVLVGVEFQAQVEVAHPWLGLVVRLRLVLRGRLLLGEEGSKAARRPGGVAPAGNASRGPSPSGRRMQPGNSALLVAGGAKTTSGTAPCKEEQSANVEDHVRARPAVRGV